MRALVTAAAGFLPACLASGLIVLGLLRTRRMDQDPRHALFRHGRPPSPLPDGPYRGAVRGYRGAWLGKAFDRAAGRGINLFDDWERPRRAYPFWMTTGPGLREPDRDVLKIDYDLPGNPVWVRRVLDEVVEVAPGRLLGQVHLRLVPRVPFTVAYFELVAQQQPSSADVTVRERAIGAST
jgi:hypothetical protein